MNKNNKIIKNATIMLLTLIVSFITISPVSAKSDDTLIGENTTNAIATLIDNEQADVTPKSGGFVSREYVVNELYKNGTYWNYKYLTSAWTYASSYTVTTST